MTYILKKNNLEIHIDHPLENYNFSRFDWTGKITTLKFQNVLLTTTERTDARNENFLGKGFYNEFGIDSPLGFEEAEIGEWFHKIGIGLLKKDRSNYEFTENYEIKPAVFDIIKTSNSLIITCKSALIQGYAYILRKEIVLNDSGFSINYDLQNTGEKEIITNEYNHNFTAINNENMGPDYVLKFPFKLKSSSFDENVNTENAVTIEHDEVSFSSSLSTPFFFSNLTGGKNMEASWELINLKQNIGIREVTSFQTKKVNLWGWKHVISPELFFDIHLKPGQSMAWSRQYQVFKVSS